MYRPRKTYKESKSLVYSPKHKGQSVIEYVVLFAIVAALSIALFTRVPGFFSTYVTAARGAMK